MPSVCEWVNLTSAVKCFEWSVDWKSATELQGCCGSEVEPASCYRKIAGSIHLIACQSVLEQDTEPQTAPDVQVGTLPATAITVWMYVLV